MAIVMAFIVAMPIGFHKESEAAPIVPPPKKEKVELVEALKPVCSCESTGSPFNTPRQFNPDGSVVRGRINPRDIGMCQINADYHEIAAKKMNMDIYTEEGNIRYANYLYEHQGLKPWSWSKPCWSKK